MRAQKKRQVWMPNLHEVKVTYNGVRRTMRLCTKCLRRAKSADKRSGESKQVQVMPSEVMTSSSQTA